MAYAAFWVLSAFVAMLSLALFIKTSWKRLDAFLVALKLAKRRKIQDDEVEAAPARRSLQGPRSWPVIGSMHELGDPKGPFEAFTRLARKYGEIYEIQLGVSKCVVVSSYRLIKEVLITKGNHFGGRPDFIRYHHLFGGDRNNSLALCDWSSLQSERRSIARKFCSPRGGSCEQSVLSGVATEEMGRFFGILNEPKNAAIVQGKAPIKPVIMAAIGNMFTQYMCSTSFGYENDQFNQCCRIFDEIFWDINQGYAVDFLPWLKTFYTRHLNRLSSYSVTIRSFILKEIIDKRQATLDLETGYRRDFTDALLFNLMKKDSKLSKEHILYELEDFIGGHSAVGNLIMMVLANAILYPEVQKKMQAECDAILGQDSTRYIHHTDRPNMPYCDGMIWETLRAASSPIVPHVATCATDIDGFPVEKDTVVFLNNHGMNTGEEYWGPDVREFKPERFIKEVVENGVTKKRFSKPDFFIPFSTGKRTCIGQRLVQGFGFVVVTSLLHKYNVSAPPGVNVRNFIYPSCLAMPVDCCNYVLTPRV